MEDVASKRPTDVVFAVVLLDVLKVGGVIDDMHTEERDGHLIGRSISLVEGVPGFAASGAVCLKLLDAPLERLAFRASNPL